MAEDDDSKQILQELHHLAIIDEDKIEKFLHATVDNLCGREQALDTFGKIGELGDVVTSVTNYIKGVVRNAQGVAINKEEVVSQLTQANVTAGTAGTLASVVLARREEIEQRLQKHASELFPRYLQDFDWSVRLITSSDHISSMKQAVVMLTLRVKDAASGKTEDVTIEMNQGDLDSFLESCGDINSVIQQLRV
mmetsp:Transcript_27990/g.55097  ORF Transcript_27990/g.55097 Transcript_27990/m.55097 type:complete len:194 (+) Transcript_27990:36-617(+)|eukprot:CAMPEP_0175144064 /NCGR_PEP_ID=MMETSP0087-20121206/13882_1 /TAXON_ID=136419 /ORGANISM="Unknown Unknown, Strain D1" /LENGTH=193 /DNA_ID=CAMNT_0016428407 /DNA_START=36 /DNA_END=617 /DNA_ORIENTATION=-